MKPSGRSMSFVVVTVCCQCALAPRQYRGSPQAVAPVCRRSSLPRRHCYLIAAMWRVSCSTRVQEESPANRTCRVHRCSSRARAVCRQCAEPPPQSRDRGAVNSMTRACAVLVALVFFPSPSAGQTATTRGGESQPTGDAQLSVEATVQALARYDRIATETARGAGETDRAAAARDRRDPRAHAAVLS